MTTSPGLSIKKPISVWNKPLKANFKDFFKSLGKAGVDAATGQWIGLGKDAVDALSAIGLESNEPEELAWALIYNSLTKAIASIISDSQFLIQDIPNDLDDLSNSQSVLVALSFVQGKLTLSEQTNLNTVYADLLNAVYERGYEDTCECCGQTTRGQLPPDVPTTGYGDRLVSLVGLLSSGEYRQSHSMVQSLLSVLFGLELSRSGIYRLRTQDRKHVAIGEMSRGNFIRILEEIALAAWHGDGRTTTVEEIKSHCDNSGLERLLEIFEEGAQAGVTRLLAAFYFRQSGIRGNERTFEFTHKSFGEYLTACRIVRAMERIQKKLDERKEYMEEGWDDRAALLHDRAALLHWTEVCGPTRMDTYLLSFLRDEVALNPLEKISQWQQTFAHLIGAMLRQGMPMETFMLSSSLKFQKANQWAINAEEALLAALGACSSVTQLISHIDWPSRVAFGAWVKRLQGQRTGAKNVVALESLSYLGLENAILYIQDLYGARLKGINLERAQFDLSRLDQVDLEEANLKGATFSSANLNNSNLRRANLKEAHLIGSDLRGTKLEAANLQRAVLGGANLEGANLEGANLEEANLKGATFSSANLNNSNLRRANLKEAHLIGSDLRGTKLEAANLQRAVLGGANLEGANLEGANLEGANLEGANLQGANLEEANLEGANLQGANLQGRISRRQTFKKPTLKNANLTNANLENISWDVETDWHGVKGLENARNVPAELKRQLGIA
jgi:uncharacterized protein YjbI with pentapeptide repeats